MALDGHHSTETSVAFLYHMRARSQGPLLIVWGNGRVHGDGDVRDDLIPPMLPCAWPA